MNRLEFEHHFAGLGEVPLHYVTAGVGFGERPQIVFVHGWPETWHEWRQVTPRLAAAGHPVKRPSRVISRGGEVSAEGR